MEFIIIGVKITDISIFIKLWFIKYLLIGIVKLTLYMNICIQLFKKTTIIKEICKQLGVLDNISSPTFSLVNEYQTNNNEKVFHFDFYRITDEEEALDIGIEEYLDNNNWCLIEWPENIENLLPLKAVQIYLSILNDEQRNIQLK